MADAVAARDRFATWAGGELDLPCFFYGPERALPEVRDPPERFEGPDELKEQRLEEDELADEPAPEALAEETVSEQAASEATSAAK